METRRLFFALPVERALAEEWATAFRAALTAGVGPACTGRLRLVHPGEWHLTLCFHGVTPAEHVERLAAAAAPRFAACRAPRVVELAGGCFPERGAARVLWAGPREAGGTEGRLALLAAAALEASREVLGEDAPPEADFRAHLTGARVPRGARGPSAEGRRAFEDWRLACDWRPAEAVLYESRGGAPGSRYHALRRFPLDVAGPEPEKSAGGA